MAMILPRTRIEPASNGEVSARIAEMRWIELRGLSHDYRDMCKRNCAIPCSFRQWLKDRVADQLIAKQYNDERSWW